MTAPVQLELSAYAARRAGELAADACAEKAERVSNFDIEAACVAILQRLASEGGPMSGEELTDYCRDVRGIKPPDDRAFGVAFRKLAKAGLITKDGYVPRTRGNCSPGLIWKLSNKQAA